MIVINITEMMLKVDVLVTDVTDDREGESNVILRKKDCFFKKLCCKCAKKVEYLVSRL